MYGTSSRDHGDGADAAASDEKEAPQFESDEEVDIISISSQDDEEEHEELQPAAKKQKVNHAKPSKAATRWQPDEDQLLLQAVADVDAGELSEPYWLAVSKQLGTGRSDRSCEGRYRQLKEKHCWLQSRRPMTRAQEPRPVLTSSSKEEEGSSDQTDEKMSTTAAPPSSPQSITAEQSSAAPAVARPTPETAQTQDDSNLVYELLETQTKWASEKLQQLSQENAALKQENEQLQQRLQSTEIEKQQLQIKYDKLLTELSTMRSSLALLKTLRGEKQ